MRDKFKQIINDNNPALVSLFYYEKDEQDNLLFTFDDLKQACEG